jgi:chorismate mutase
VQLEEIQETQENISAPTDLVQEVQNVVSPDVEAPAPRRSIRAHHTTEEFTLLTTEQCDVLLLDNDEPMTYTEAMMGPDSEK